MATTMTPMATRFGTRAPPRPSTWRAYCVPIGAKASARASAAFAASDKKGIGAITPALRGSHRLLPEPRIQHETA